VAFIRANSLVVHEQERELGNPRPEKGNTASQATIEAIGFILFVGFLIAVFYYGTDHPRDSWSGIIHNGIIPVAVFTSIFWVPPLFIRVRGMLRDSHDQDFKLRLDRYETQMRQRSELLATRQRNKSSEIEITINRLSEMQRPEFWPTEA
jgi:hypothetical protein